MSGESKSSAVRRPRPRLLRWLLILLVAVVAAGAIGVYSWMRPVVDWHAVSEAVGNQDTLHGKGRVYLTDGSQWDYALWAQVEGSGDTVSNGLLRPVRLPPGSKELSAKPDTVLLTLCRAMDVCGEQGLITKLASAEGPSRRATRSKWRGRPALTVELDTPPDVSQGKEGYPDSWRIALEERTGLVLAVSMFAEAAGESRLRATCEYEYNAALPSGFKAD